MENNQETKMNLVTERDKHFQNADNAYSSKLHDKEISKLDPTSVCIVFDLQRVGIFKLSNGCLEKLIKLT